MAYTETYDQAVANAKAALDEMEKHHLPPVPHNFEVWYTYAAGNNPDLTRAIDEHLGIETTVSPDICDTLYARLCGYEATSRAIRDTGSQLAGELTRICEYLERASHDTSAYGNALEGVSGIIERGESGDRLGEMIEKVLRATRHIETKTRALESELEQSGQEIRRLQENLELTKREAITDTLTGLANRKHFDEQLQEAMREAEENDEPLALLLCDIDHFKQFNDRWGHLTGDQVLRLVGRCLEENVKGRDTAARFGGEEFAVIFPQTTLVGAKVVGNHIRQTVERKKIVKKSSGDLLGRITMSFGAAQYRKGERIVDFVARADLALYAAKDAGRNRVVGEDETGGRGMPETDAA